MHLSTRVAIYCRVSTEEQANEGFSIAAQRKILSEYSSSNKWCITKIYTDEGISGNNSKRPAFQTLLKDANNECFDIVLVWKINRFSRKNADLLNTVEYLRKYNINLISFSERFDASTPTGKLMLSMLGSIGEFERDTIIENIRAGMLERAEQGLFNGGRILGYDSINKRLIVNVKEATIVKKIFDLYIMGNGYSKIANELNSKGYKTKNSLPFSICSVKRILKNPLYSGYITYNKINNIVIKSSRYILSKGSHEPIISKDNFDTIQNMIESKKHTFSNYGDYILSGIIKCPICGSNMIGHTSGKNYRYYICTNYKQNGLTGCRCKCINAVIIEIKIIDYICSLLYNPKIVNDVYLRLQDINKSRTPDIENEIIYIQNELSRKIKTLNKYLNLLENDAISPSMLSSRISETDCSIKLMNQKLETLKNENQKVSDPPLYKVDNILLDFKAKFLKLNIYYKKRLISSLITKVSFEQNFDMKYIVLNFTI